MIFKDIAAVGLGEGFLSSEKISVGVKSGKIDYIGPFKSGYGEEFDGNGFLLAPAYYSSHSHTAMTLLRGVGGDLPLDRWLHEAIFPLERKLTPDDIYNGVALGCAEMLYYGVAGCNDMYFAGLSMAKAYIDAGLKANVSVAVTCSDSGKSYLGTNEKKENDALFEYLKNNDDVKADISAHAEYTNTVKVLEGVVEEGFSRGAGLHIHLSETKREHLGCVGRHGVTPAFLFDKLSAFSLRTVAAHCVWCGDDDFALMGEKGVFMASCPTSNLKLASGIPDYNKAASHGVRICLGTDGVASNNNLNMTKEAKLMALLSKGVSLDAASCTAMSSLKAATRLAWLSSGRDSGVIKEGCPADLAVYKLGTPNVINSQNPADTLVYSHDGIAYLTMCGGKVLYKNGEYFTIDIEKVKRQAKIRR